MAAKAPVHEFGIGVDVHGRDSTKAAWRVVSDAIRHSSLPLLRTYLESGGRILIDVTIGVRNPDSVNVEQVQQELPVGEVTVCAVEGGLAVPGADTLIECAAITVCVEERVDGMKPAGLPLDVVAYAAPQELHAFNAAERGGQPSTILGAYATLGPSLRPRSPPPPLSTGPQAAAPVSIEPVRSPATAASKMRSTTRVSSRPA